MNSFQRGMASLLLAGIALAVFATPTSARVCAYATLTNTDRVAVIDDETGSVTHIPVAGQPRALAISPDGTRVYVAGVSSRMISTIDTATNTVILSGPSRRDPRAIVVSPD